MVKALYVMVFRGGQGRLAIGHNRFGFSGYLWSPTMNGLT